MRSMVEWVAWCWIIMRGPRRDATWCAPDHQRRIPLPQVGEDERLSPSAPWGHMRA